MFFKAAVVAAAVGTVVAQRPENTPICDYYTTALLMNNTAANQKTLLTLVVNTAVIGNYTMPNKNAVPGILAAGEYNGTAVNLLPYFSGGLASSNRGGSSGVSVNFLDGGGAAPLMNNTAATDTTSNQYMLLSHLYEYFGGLLGCTQLGMTGYPAYDGQSSMYEVHKFMDLSAAEFGYFVQQVALSAQSFGVATSDIMAVGAALQGAFGFKDSPPMAVVTKDPQLQAICIGEGCPVAEKAVTSGYAVPTEPAVANSSLVPPPSSATGSATPAMTGSAAPTGGESSTPAATGTGAGATPTPSNTTGSASSVGFSLAAVVAGVVAFFI